jgi:hypothetical protein
MAGTAAYGFANGDPLLLLTGWDADGKSISQKFKKDVPLTFEAASGL